MQNENASKVKNSHNLWSLSYVPTLLIVTRNLNIYQRYLKYHISIYSVIGEADLELNISD